MLERVVYWTKKPRDPAPTPGALQPMRMPDYVSSFNKPKGGLWTSPEGSEWGWEDWCRSEMSGWLGDRYVLTVEGSPRILCVDSEADLEEVWKTYGRAYASWDGGSMTNPAILAQRDLHFGWIANDYDAFWLTARGHSETRMGMDLNTYAWDCETVLWFRWMFSEVRQEVTA